MDLQEQQRQETLLSLFEHDGWKIVISELEENIEYLKNNAHYNCVTNDQWQYHKGQLIASENFAAFENIIRVGIDLEEQEDLDV